jgi:hypothetical protein
MSLQNIFSIFKAEQDLIKLKTESMRNLFKVVRVSIIWNLCTDKWATFLKSLTTWCYSEEYELRNKYLESVYLVTGIH